MNLHPNRERKRAVSSIYPLLYSRGSERDRLLALAVRIELLYSVHAMLERFALSAKMAVRHAYKEAVRLRSESVGVLHLLLGILNDESSVVVRALVLAGVNVPKLRESAIAEIPEGKSESASPPNFTDYAREVLERANDFSDKSSHGLVNSEHLMLAILTLPRSKALNILRDEDVEFSWMKRAVGRLNAKEAPPPLPDLLEPDAAPVQKEAKPAPSYLRALGHAKEEAARLNCRSVKPEHILLGILHDSTSLAVKILLGLDVNIVELGTAVIKETGRGDTESGEPGLSNESTMVLVLAGKEASKQKQSHIGSEHLLLGILSLEHSYACRILSRFLVTYQDALKSLTQTSGAPFAVRKSFTGVLTPSEWERFSSSTRRLVKRALDLARQNRSDAIYPEHFLFGFFADLGSTALPILGRLGANLETILRDIDREIPRGQSSIETLQYTNETRAILKRASQVASELRLTFIEPEHILLGILASPDSGAYEILNRHGITYGDVKDIVILGVEGVPRMPVPGKERVDMGAYGIGGSQSEFEYPYPPLLPRFGPPDEPPKMRTDSAQAAIASAYGEAKKAGSSEVNLEHMLLALLNDENSLVSNLLKTLGVKLDELVSGIRERVPISESRAEATLLGHKVRRALWLADDEAKRLGLRTSGPLMILLGILRTRDPELLQFLDSHGLHAEAAQSHVESMVKIVDQLAQEMGLKSAYPVPFQKLVIPLEYGPGIYAEIIDLARLEAAKLGAGSLSVDHLFLALLQRASGMTGEYLLRSGITYEDALAFITGKPAEPTRPPRGELSVFSAMENLSPSGKKAVEQAIREALSSQSCRIEVGHLALGAISDDEGKVGQALTSLGMDVGKLREAIKAATTCKLTEGSSIVFAEETSKALEEADRVSRELGHELVSADDILLGILGLEGSVQAAMKEAGMDILRFRTVIREKPPEG